MLNMIDIASQRLLNLGIAEPKAATVGQIVARLGAVQAQDWPGTLWALGLRTPGARQADIEQAIAERTIVRTWPMRGTLHFVAAADVRWMLALGMSHTIASHAGRHRQLELDEVVFARSKDLLVPALQGGNQLTRPEIFEVLERGNISCAGQRGIHILWRLAQEGLVCFGLPDGKHTTFVLLDEWLAASDTSVSPGVLERDEALAKLAHRYFTSHGPATLQDFVWWSGLRVADARAGLEGAKPKLEQAVVDGQTYWLSPEMPTLLNSSPTAYLLPGFDEYLLGYRDRRAVLDPAYNQKIVPGSNGIFMPTIICAGRVVGTWKRAFKKNTVIITLEPFAPLSQAQLQAVEVAAERYGHFMGRPVIVVS